MRIFVSCILLALFFQLATSSLVIKRSEVEASKDQSSEKYLPVFHPPLPPYGLPPTPPPAFLPPPPLPPPPFYPPPPPRPFGLKDNSPNEKHCDIDSYMIVS
ncbi:hypothetical protein BY996DRAFT_6419855 [Phakopsora pachyrhizi]|nr:hypothetical protein BY996DRAFT_6419855 [Phakopsora pachyrhizi]